MKKNQVFKEIEARIIEVSGRPFISMDDLDRIISDIIFTKSGLDTHTLRTLKRLCASIALTYKALKENEQLDINEELALVPLSKKKVRNLVKKSLKISAKDKSLEGDLDELEPYLAPEEESLEISREETEELIQGSIQEGLEPYIKLLAEIDRVVKSTKSKPGKEEESLEISREETEELIQGSIQEGLEPYIKLLAEIDRVVKSTKSKPGKEEEAEKLVPTKKKKSKKKEPVSELVVPETAEDSGIDFEALEEEMK